MPVFHRYVALGDSVTEGVGDPDPARPNGVRGWADREFRDWALWSEDRLHMNCRCRWRRSRPSLPANPSPGAEPGFG